VVFVAMIHAGIAFNIIPTRLQYQERLGLSARRASMHSGKE